MIGRDLRFDAIDSRASSSGISFGTLQKHQPNPRSTMTRICLNCKAAASKDVPILCCGACRSAVYCSRVCQKEHWKEHSKKICEFLNVGEGAMQVRSVKHTKTASDLKAQFENQERSLGKAGKDSSNSSLNLRWKEVRLRRER
jgi:hypothetical protein